MTRPPRLQNGPFSWCRLLPGRSIAMLIRPMVKVSFCSFCHPSLFFSPTHPPPPCSTHNTKSTMLQGSTQSHITQSTLCCISYWLRTHHTNCTILYTLVQPDSVTSAHTQQVPGPTYPVPSLVSDPPCAKHQHVDPPAAPAINQCMDFTHVPQMQYILHSGKPHTGDMWGPS